MNPPKQKGLGRGLDALLAANNAPEAQRQDSLPVGVLQPGKYQPRTRMDPGSLEELAASIKAQGLIQPISVRPVGNGRFEIIAGERRWRAAQRANLHEVPVIVRALSDSQAVEIAIIENVQREDLNAVEEAEGYRLLMDGHGYTQEDLSKVIGKSRSHLANTLRLLKLPQSVQELLREGALSAGHARCLIGRADAEALALRIVNEGLTVREVEALVQEKQPGASKARKKTSKSADTRAAEAELKEALGLDVDIRSGRGEKGELRIRYTSLDQLEDLRHRLLRRPGHR